MTKTLLYDIEICHNYDESYQRRMYTGYLDASVRMSADVSYITHFGYKWLEEKRIYCKDLTDFKSFKTDIYNERELLEFISKLFLQADHLVGHYATKFDRRYLNAKFLQYGLPPIPSGAELKQSDTCLLARQHLKLSSNRLDNVAQFLKMPMKRKKNWPDDWIKMTKGDKEAFKRVKTYCIGDIVTLENVYKKLRTLSLNSPNLSHTTNTAVCPACGSSHYFKNGSVSFKGKIRQRYVCRDCGKRFKDCDLIRMNAK